MARKHVSWLAAAGLSVAGAAAAQGPGLFQSRPASLPVATRPAPRPAASPDRNIEVQVQLALLADPVTFPYYVEARVQGRSLELHGTVPTRAVRDHAVKLARLQAPNLTLVDGMREHAGVTARLPGRAGNVEGAAKTALRQSLPGQDRNLSVQHTTDGRLLISGRVNTLEEKLAVSQALRRLHGVSGVANQVVVAEGVGHVAAATPTPAKTPSPASDTFVANDSDLQLGGPVQGVVQADAKVVASTPNLQPVQHVVPAAQPKQTLPTPLGQSAGKPNTPMMMVEPTPPGSGKASRPALFPWLSGQKNASGSPFPIMVPGNVNHAKGQTAQPQVSHGVVLVQADGKTPAEPAVTAPAAKAPPVVSAPAANTQPVAVPPQAQAQQAARLKRVVEKAGGAAVRNVQVSFRSPTAVTVQFTARSEADANRLGSQLQVLPELRDYQVEMSVQVAGTPR